MVWQKKKKKKERERESFKCSGVYNKKLYIGVTIRKYFYVESSILRHVLIVDNIQLMVIDKGHFKAQVQKEYQGRHDKKLDYVESEKVKVFQ